MTRLKSQSRQQPTCPEQLKKIMSTLFPKQESFAYQMEQQDEGIPLISREELFRANNRIGKNKAPGIENIPKVALKMAIKALQRKFSQSDGSGKNLCSHPRTTSRRMTLHPIAHCACWIYQKKC